MKSTLSKNRKTLRKPIKPAFLFSGARSAGSIPAGRASKIKAYRVNQFKIGGSGIGKRSGTKDHDGEPFILFYKKVK